MDKGAGTNYKLLAFGRVIAVYKDNHCVHHTAIQTFYLLQHHVHNYFASFSQQSDLLATCAKRNNHMYAYTSPSP